MSAEADHVHNWFHYYVVDEGDGQVEVFEDVYEPRPLTYLSEGYRCWCGARPDG